MDPIDAGGAEAIKAYRAMRKHTLETEPRIEFYRRSIADDIPKRATILQLHELQNAYEDISKSAAVDGDEAEGKPIPQEAPKFGWIIGVFIRCLLNIFGVMLFLRIPWVVGQAGIALGSCVVLLAALVTTLTALSMSAICTNGEVRGGGAYFMISRNLGPEIGGPMGLIYSIANAVAAAMYCVGFAETIRDILKNHGRLMIDDLNDVRIIGVISITVMLIVAIIGLEWETKAQIFLMIVLTVAIANYFIGSFIPPSTTQYAEGFRGYQVDLFLNNMIPDFRDGYNFFTVFGVYFPAATGILAGANISGDLKDAQKSLPKGTLLANFVATLTYIGVAWIAGLCVLRDAPGLMVPDLANNSTFNFSTDLLATAVYQSAATQTGFVTAMISGQSHGRSNTSYTTMSECHGPHTCSYGLHNSMMITQMISAFGPITIAGIVSATLSSALASIVSAPKVFQAVCKDKIFPWRFMTFFGKGSARDNEPRRAYMLAYAIGLAFTIIADLNAIAPLISNFFLISYCLINYTCFYSSLSKSPGWRPGFRYYSKWASLFGSFLTLAVMFLLSWWTALLTIAFIFLLNLYVRHINPDINWGSSGSAHAYTNALRFTKRLLTIPDHVKNYRPQILVLSGFPGDRPGLLHLVNAMTKDVSIMVAGDIIFTTPNERLQNIKERTNAAYERLRAMKVNAFYVPIFAPSLRTGARAMIQCSGLGKMRPNVIVLGFKNDWKAADFNELDDYFYIIHDAFDVNCGVGILRMRDEISRCTYDVNRRIIDTIGNDNVKKESPTLRLDIPADVERGVINSAYTPDRERKITTASVYSVADPSVDITEITDAHTLRRKQSGFIDVWWLFDDGGLTVLLPYIINSKSKWRKCKIRVFMKASKEQEMQKAQMNMLKRFRIDVSSVHLIPDMDKIPHQESRREFDKLIQSWILDEANGETPSTHPGKISNNEINIQKERTNRHIRMREVLLEHSRGSSLIVVTLPMPRWGLVSARLYMSWVDTLTRDMPPILLVRGNQESVLTYHS